jgi:hypothetical protein
MEGNDEVAAGLISEVEADLFYRHRFIGKEIAAPFQQQAIVEVRRAGIGCSPE